MVVIGFDFGNSSSYIAAAKEGGIEVITNDYSLHATPSCVSFGKKSRSMGYAARQQLNFNFKNTIINFKHLIGHNFSDSIVKDFTPFIPCEVVRLNDDKIGFKVNYKDEDRVFTPVQILACLLTKLKQITENELKVPVSYCVISVPYFISPSSRSNFLAAAKISGLNTTKIVTDHAAIATAYGIYKGSGLPPQDQPPKIVAFVDAGHSCIQASVISFNEGKATVLGASHDNTVGGLFLDNCMRDHFRESIVSKYKIDPINNRRAWQRLLDECEKIRKQMSANSTAIPLTIECFMEGIDISGTMQRSQFESLAEPLFNKIISLLRRLFEQYPDIKLEELSGVELIGGCSRIPKIRNIVAEFFKREPMTTMNLDDAIARGCALRSSILSPTVIIKEFIVDDIFDQEEIQCPDDISTEVNCEADMIDADKAEMLKADAKNALEEYCYSIRNKIESFPKTDLKSVDQKNGQQSDVQMNNPQKPNPDEVTEEEKQMVIQKAGEMLYWLEDCDDSCTRAQYEERHRELKEICEPILTKLTKPKLKQLKKGFLNSDKTDQEKQEQSPGQQKQQLKDDLAMQDGNAGANETTQQNSASGNDDGTIIDDDRQMSEC